MLILLVAAEVESDQEAYYLDPPSPPYCTPMYREAGCFPYGRFRPRLPLLSPLARGVLSDLDALEPLPSPSVILLTYSWLQTPVQLTYTPVAQYLGESGIVEFEVVGDSAGRVTKYRILSSSSPYLEQAVVRSIATFRLKPGAPGAHRGRVVFLLPDD